MLTLPPSVRIYLATTPTDMRKGHDGLRALVERDLDANVYSGHLFVFVSRKGDRIKILTWDHGGFVLWYKRLERGKFRLPRVAPSEQSIQLDGAQLAMLLDGIDYSRVRRPQNWKPGSARSAMYMNNKAKKRPGGIDKHSQA